MEYLCNYVATVTLAPAEIAKLDRLKLVPWLFKVLERGVSNLALFLHQRPEVRDLSFC